jgi:hypothetical protein
MSIPSLIIVGGRRLAAMVLVGVFYPALFVVSVRGQCIFMFNVVYNDVFCIGRASSKIEQIDPIQLYEFLGFLGLISAMNGFFTGALCGASGTKPRLCRLLLHCLRAISGLKPVKRAGLFTSPRGSPTIE